MQSPWLLVERALLESISGEFDASRQTAEVAKAADVSSEWIHVILGSIAFHEGRPNDAIEELIVAREIAPDNVPALSLLSFAYVFEGRWDEWSELTAEIAAAEPGDEYPVFDNLFLGYASFYLDYQAAADRLEVVLRVHPSWLAPRIVLAAAWALQARRVPDVSLLREARRELGRGDVFSVDTP